MRIKIVFIVVVVFVLIFFFGNAKDEKIIKQEVVSQTKIEKPLDKIDLKSKPIINKQVITSQLDPISEHSEYEEPIDVIYRELSVGRYSQEPAVELASVMREMLDCGYIKSYERYKFITNKGQLSSIQQDVYRTYQDNCIEVNDTYPTIIEYDQSGSKKRTQDFTWILMNSPYRELVVNSQNFKRLDSSAQTQFVFDLTKAIIKSQSSQTLLFLSTMLTKERQFFNALKLPQVLSSVNSDYVRMIVAQATVLMSCQYNNGISCAPSSHYMTVICFEDERACGMDVESWFKYNHSFSHNKDIDKIIRNFQTFLE